jgi:transketolase
MKDYKKTANEARKAVLDLIYKAQTSHIGSNFSCIDILSVLYDIAEVDKEMKEDRDRIVVSKGWAAAAVYYFLSEKEIIPKEDLKKYCEKGSEYIGLVEPSVRGVEAAGGSMGFGFPFGVGFALAKKVKSEKGKSFVLTSDGEMDCGTTWESALIAKHNNLDNLTVIIDHNGLQGMGEVKKILDIDPLKEKWQAFGWEVKEIDGHNFEQICQALTSNSEKPLAVIAKTVKGKGVSFMENDNLWHYKAPSEEEYKKAMEELCQK